MGMVVIQPFCVKTKEDQDMVWTLYWSPKLHKNPIKQDTLLILVLVWQLNFLNYLPCVLQLLKKHVIKYHEKVYERSGKNLFWSVKDLGEILDKLKDRDFNVTSFSDFSMIFLLFTLLYLMM